jgi:hypothetical protein
MALVRAVGHVLAKIDGKDKAVAQTAAKLFREWKSDDPKHEIFKYFIEEERNNILKEYRSAVDQRSAIPVAAAGEDFSLDDCLFRPLTDGPWAGEDARDVLMLAIEWWEEQLSRVDAARLSQLPGGPR